ncbi:hypothetical protein ACHAXN_013319 [Cyclotella atomus]
MAKGKGKSRNSNKKKGGGGGGGNRAGNISSSTYLKGEIPDFGSRSQANRDNYLTAYSRYKRATNRFMDYMRKNVPRAVIEGEEKNVIFLLYAADWMMSSSHTLDPKVLKDLRVSIRMRKRVAKSYFGGGDATHKYFIDILVYCWTVLRLLPTETDERTALEQEDEETDDHRNLYAALGVEIDDEEEDDEETFPTEVPRPVPDKIRVTIDELMKADDRTDAIIFLSTMDDLMAMVANQYQVIYKNIKNYRQRGYPESSIVEHLLEAAITVSFAIQQVQQLEMELQAQHEHLTTPCRLLATLVLPEITSEVNDTLRKHAKGTKQWGSRDIVSFLGDCMQCFFLNASDDWNRSDTIVREFCHEYEVDEQGRTRLDQLFIGLQQIVIREVPTKMEENDGAMQKVNAILERFGKSTSSHTWLPNSDFIGGDRCIIHTVRMLQLFAGVVATTKGNNHRHLDPKLAGMFGSPNWLLGRSRKIRDLDELLMATILPEWMKMARYGIVGQMRFPRENEICPLFMQFKYYVENPRTPVSWSLAFGVHSMLTSILELDNENQRLMKVSKICFDQFFATTTNAAKLSMNDKTSAMSNSHAWKNNICMVSVLESFGMDGFKEDAIWNPLCASTNLSIISLFGNLEIGSASIDCQGQLRIVMYLYHGLLINGIIRRGDIQMLDILYDAFKDCRAIWCGALPRKGELVQRFWICLGTGLKESKQMSEKAQFFARSGTTVVSHEKLAEEARLCRGRKMQSIEPRELSTCFRRVCERDFSGVVDKYHTPEQRKNSQGLEQYLFAVRTNDTLDHLEDETQLFSINFFSTAFYLEQFVCSIGRVLQWENFMKSFSRIGCTDMRQGFAILFAQHLLGALDFSRDPLNHDFLHVPLGLASSSFLKTFFAKIPPSNVLWFQAMQSDEGSVEIQTLPYAR